MYGQNVNQLNVKLGGTNVFQKSGPQGNTWKKAEVSINGRGNVCIHHYTLYFVKTFLNIKILITRRLKINH